MSSETPSQFVANVVVAGDICLDVVGIPQPPLAAPDRTVDNWKMTGEMRTHFLPGGVHLLQKWVEDALDIAHPTDTQPLKWNVIGHDAHLPDALTASDSGTKLVDRKQLLEHAERLTRSEVVHSLLELNWYPVSRKAKDENKECMRVSKTLGFAGPVTGDPSLIVEPPQLDAVPHLTVLDDTGNRFRRRADIWPHPLRNDSPTASKSLLIYKLHRPLPSSVIQSELWTRTKERYPRNRVVVVSIEDLRRLDAPISRGLSWERTALETIWHLRNNDHFSELCAIPHLIVRLGLDGAIYWGLRQPGAEGHDATLIYDAQTIEGVSDEACDGSMVGYGSAFTAALTSHLARCVEPVLLSGGDLQVQKEHVVAGIKLGITASRSLLKNGFGTPKTGPHDTEWDKAPTKCKQEPQYPGGELFTDRSAQDLPFSDAAIPMIPGAKESDRGYWRLLESKFSGKSRLLTHAVGTLARRSSPLTTEEVSKLSMRRQVGASQPVSDDPREFWRQPEFDAVLEASTLLNAVPIASFGKHLKTYDRREIEHLRALYSLLAEYSRNRKPVRPLSVAVFGPPGAGKSFGVKAVAAELARRQPSRPLQDLTFNLSQYDSPGQLSEAFHLVRDVSLKGKLPLVFFDEFDSRLNRVQLGWLRYFLAPMQDGEFLDKGEIHPIGPAIFIFAGGTSSTYAEFARPLTLPSDDPEWKRFRTVKAPDFLSRLRGALDIPGLDLNAPYDPYGPAENLPSREAVLLRRAMILAHQVKTKAAHLLDSNGTLQISDAALSALIQLPGFVHGNRSFEAILDMSRLTDADRLQPSCFPADSHVELHANPGHLNQLLGTYQFTADEHQKIAAAIHEAYRQKELERIYPDGSIPDDAKLPPNLKAWKDLSTEFRGSNLEQAEHIPFKLRAAGLWFRKRPAAAGERTPPPPAELPDHVIERIARSEHDRWVTERRKQGWIAARGQDRKHRDDALKHHNCLFRWEELDDDIQQKDRDAVTDIPIYLAAAGFELIDQ